MDLIAVLCSLPVPVSATILGRKPLQSVISLSQPLQSVVSISQPTLLLVPLFGCAVLSAVLGAITFRYRHRSGATPLSVLLIGTAVWTFTYGMQVSQLTLSNKLFWSRLTYIGLLSVPVALLAFTLEYTDRDRWLSPVRFGSVCLIPALLLGIALLKPRLLMPKPYVAEGKLAGPYLQQLLAPYLSGTEISVLQFGDSPLWTGMVLYQYLLMIVSITLVGKEFVQLYRVGTFRGQALSILLAMCVPLALDVYRAVAGLDIALAPIGLSIAGILLSVALFRYQLLDVPPVARRTVVENMDDGFVVLDQSGRVIDANETADQIIPDSETLLDRQIEAVLPELSPDSDTLNADLLPDEIRLTHTVESADQQSEHIYQVDTTVLRDGNDQQVALALVLRDVTEKRRQQERLRERKQQLEEKTEQLEHKTEQLEAQNERLDEFASLLSHDLRNPLGVAKGYLELLDVEDQNEELQKVQSGLDRMEQLIDEALQLAREGQSVTETETVSLPTVVDEAWQSVETGEATLETDIAGATVDADPARLRRLFENLFRNAVEHCQPDVTITVEQTGDRFRVADDGPGIPADKRDQIFEKGFTTAEDGTGFGLAIVETIVAAHGWEITIEESDVGGAAFLVDCQLSRTPRSRSA